MDNVIYCGLRLIVDIMTENTLRTTCLEFLKRIRHRWEAAYEHCVLNVERPLRNRRTPDDLIQTPRLALASRVREACLLVWLCSMH